MTTCLTAPLKWHGGKHKLAAKILALAPSHAVFIEPYFGGGRVLLRKNPSGVSEIVNDINGRLTNFWRVLQGEESFSRFHRIVEAVPFSQQEFGDAMGLLDQGDDVEQAVRFFIIARMSLSGRMKDFTSISKSRGRRGMNEQVSAWLTTIDGLPAVHARLKRVLILNDDALTVIRQNDGSDVWFYLDPTYLAATRTAKKVYEYEMTNAQHGQLLLTLARIKGKFALSGYRSKLYDAFAAKLGWNRHDFQVANHAAGGTNKRTMTECLWCNY